MRGECRLLVHRFANRASKKLEAHAFNKPDLRDTLKQFLQVDAVRILIASLFAFNAFLSFAQEEKVVHTHDTGEVHPTAIAIKTSTPPKIDGMVTEEEWAGATRIEDFVQVIPVPREEPSEKTLI